GRADDGGAQVRGKAIELVHPPVGILAGQPGGAELRLDAPKIGAAVGDAHHQRLLAAVEGEPVSGRVHKTPHPGPLPAGEERGGPSTVGSRSGPAASITAPLLTSSMASCMSGWK